LLSIGLLLIGVNFIRLLPTHFPAALPLERIVLSGLFLLLSLAIWYLATARRNAIERASRAAAERERTITQLEELLSMVSHDMRTPLGGVNLSLYALDKIAEGGDTRFQRPLASAHRQIARILRLVDRLLEPMRMEGSSEELQLETFDLSALVKEVVDGMAPQLEEANCSLELHLEPVSGSWDRFRLERVLTNLLSNAVQHAGGTTIIVRLQAEPGIARLSVQDHGPGIAPEESETIFKRFERARSANVKRESLGLGLYIARRIVEAHEGTIVVQSEVGKGATFFVTLPIKTVTQSESPAKLSKWGRNARRSPSGPLWQRDSAWEHARTIAAEPKSGLSEGNRLRVLKRFCHFSRSPHPAL